MKRKATRPTMNERLEGVLGDLETLIHDGVQNLDYGRQALQGQADHMMKRIAEIQNAISVILLSAADTNNRVEKLEQAELRRQAKTGKRATIRRNNA